MKQIFGKKVFFWTGLFAVFSSLGFFLTKSFIKTIEYKNNCSLEKTPPKILIEKLRFQFRFDEDLVIKKYVPFMLTTPKDEFENVNDKGYRMSLNMKQLNKEQKHVILMGMSGLYGMLPKYNVTMPGFFERILNNKFPEFTFVNFSLPAASTTEHLISYKRYFNQLNPKLFVLEVFWGEQFPALISDNFFYDFIHYFIKKGWLKPNENDVKPFYTIKNIGIDYLNFINQAFGKTLHRVNFEKTVDNLNELISIAPKDAHFIFLPVTYGQRLCEQQKSQINDYNKKLLSRFEKNPKVLILNPDNFYPPNQHYLFIKDHTHTNVYGNQLKAKWVISEIENSKLLIP